MVSLRVVLGGPAVQVQLKKHHHLPLPPVIRAQSVDDLTQHVATVQVYPIKSETQLIIIIMYIYHALINAMRAHIIHIHPKQDIYTHTVHSPTKTIYIKYYTKKIQQQNKKTHYKHTHMKDSKERLFVMTQTHNRQISGVIPFIKRQNDT